MEEDQKCYSLSGYNKDNSVMFTIEDDSHSLMPRHRNRRARSGTNVKFSKCGWFSDYNLPLFSRSQSGIAYLKDGYLNVYDSKSGTLLHKLFLGEEYKFRELDFDEVDGMLILHSGKRGAFRTTRTILIKTAPQLSFLGCFNWNLFGPDTRTVSVEEGLIFHQANNGVMSLYALDKFLSCKTCSCDFMQSCGLHEAIGQEPFGVPINCRPEALPPCLLSFRCAHEPLDYSPTLNLLLYTPYNKKCSFEILSVASGQTAKIEEFEEKSIHDDCSFHPDESGRIIYNSNHTLRIIRPKIEDDGSITLTTEWEKRTEMKVPRDRDSSDSSPEKKTRTSCRSTAFRGPFYVLPKTLFEIHYNVLLDILVYRSVSPEDMWEHCLQVYDNRNMTLLYIIPLDKLYRNSRFDFVLSNGRLVYVEADNDSTSHSVTVCTVKFRRRKKPTLPTESKKKMRKRSCRGILGLLSNLDDDDFFDDSSDEDFRPSTNANPEMNGPDGRESDQDTIIDEDSE